MKRTHRSKFMGVLLLASVSVALLLVVAPFHSEKHAVTGAATPMALRVIPGIHRDFLAKVPPNFLLPAPGDELGVRLLAEHGAGFGTGNTGGDSSGREICTDDNASQ